MADQPFKQGPQGSTAKGTAFDIQPKGDATRTRIKSVRVKAGWAVDSIQVQYETLGTTPPETYLSTSGGSTGGNLVEFSLASDDYITEIIGSWGTGAPGYPKQEIVTLQFKTYKGVTSPVMGGGNAQKEVEPFSLKAPPDCEIIGFFGEHGNTLYNLGIYLQNIPKATRTRSIIKTGKIVINADEWTLSDEGFKRTPDAAVFATNIAKWFTGSRAGKFHAYSTNFGLTQSALAQAMQKAGHTWTTGTNIKFDLSTLLTYDGIFLGRDAADNQVLIEYVKAGGNVYVMAGTETGDANRWNPFLNTFGFKFFDGTNSIAGNQTVNNSHPILAGVKALYQDCGNSIVNLDTTSNKNQIILTSSNGQGLVATFEGTPNKPVTKTGKLVVNADDWTLRDEEFKNAPDAAVFATNIAKWFVGGRPGKFHAYSTNAGLTGSALAQTMQKAGHTWTTGTNIKFDLTTLLTYDGIFVGGDAADNQVLIEYVKAGGNVYVMAGTGAGDAQSEANRWNPFLNAFGFNYLGQYNGIVGNQTVNNSHPILVGVKTLYQDKGHSIVKLDTASNKNQLILTSSSGEGLIATFEGTPNQPI